MSQLTFQSRFLNGFVSQKELEREQELAIQSQKTLLSKTGPGREFLGWLDLPQRSQSNDLQSIREAAESLQDLAPYLVVVGIGGSYLGAKAIIDALASPFMPYEDQKKKMKILYAGHHLDADYHAKLLAFLESRDFCVNVISKSGTTTEPAIAFRLLLSLLERKYGKDGMRKRVVATTDSSKGALRKLSTDCGFQTFVIPDDVGGRFSVLTPVGLLPIACSGKSIHGLIEGAVAISTTFQQEESNLAILYAAARNAIYKKGKKIEVLVNYNPALQYLTEWWKQLFGESEGKEKKGIFPAGVNFTSDLHSMGQYLQDGERHLFETVLSIQKPILDLYMTQRDDDIDGLNYLAGKKLSEVNHFAKSGTLVAHYDGGVPILEIGLESLDEKNLGALVYFFEYACGVSGYMLGVNPFDQPGVEDYKNNMFALLGKRGFEAKKSEIESKLTKL